MIQAIYGWRGAQVENMLRFEQDFPTAQVIRLEQNYRSTGCILKVADSLIRNNRSRLGKTLWTKDGDGDLVKVCRCLDEQEEADLIAETINHEHHGTNKVPLREMAILVRTIAQMRVIEERLIENGIPYHVVGGTRFYERAEIRDAIAYINVTLNPHTGLYLERILNNPRRGVGDKSRGTIVQHAHSNGLSLFNAVISALENGLITGSAKRGLQELIAAIERWHQMSATYNAGDLIKTILQESGYIAALQAQNSIDAEAKLDNLKEFAGQLTEVSDITDFLERISLLTESAANSGEDRVQLMTLHAAKGLEFHNVFLPGWEEELFPQSARTGRGRPCRTRGRTPACLCWSNSRPHSRLVNVDNAA